MSTEAAPPVALGEKMSESELCPDELLKGQEAAFARDIERLKARRAEFVTVRCPACGGDQATPTLEKFTFPFGTCRACGTLYMNPRPSPQVMADYYGNSENYQYWAKYIFPASEASRREKIHKPWLERILGYCKRFGVAPGTLLEVGAGFGTFSAVAQASGAFQRVVAVEPTPEMAAACRARGLEVIDKRIEDLAGEVQIADVAAAFEVIEHLFEPRQFLQQCARVIKPGGLLVLSCPNGQGFDVAMLGAHSWAIDAEHVNLFNPASLTRLVASCGFEVLSITTPGRLDAEFVRRGILEGALDVSRNPFLQRVLIDEWDRLGWPFQQFLADHGLSSHMWMAARKQ